MQHAVKPVVERLGQDVLIEQVGHDQVCALRNGVAMATREVVQYDHVVAVVEQLAGDDRADIARAPGYKELHIDRAPLIRVRGI